MERKSTVVVRGVLAVGFAVGGGIEELAARRVEPGPHSATPAHLDQPIRFVEHQHDLLSGVKLLAIEQADPAARQVGREHLALGRLGLEAAGLRKNDRPRPAPKRASASASA